MKSIWVGCLLICAIALTISAYPQADAYQPGKIVGLGKLSDDQGPNGHHAGATDAPLTADVQIYNVSIQVGDIVYVCRYQAHSGQEMSWLQDKDVQVRVDGKIMYVKTATGKDARATILQSNSGDQP